MNRMEHFFCSTSLWRSVTHLRLLPWVLSGARVGDHVLEIGAGYGAATGHLLKLAPRVTSLEYDARLLAKLAAKHQCVELTTVCGDAAALPFADQSFSSVVAILVLHHLKSRELQDRALAEVHRVLRPGGSFFMFEINDGWIHRAAHFKSTFTPVTPGSAFARLTKVGFSKVSVDFRSGGYRVMARRAAEETAMERAAAASATA
ncbi:MAG TPA: class I SAM-dependent methyltransferase [Candidatus Limnocylindrales bacterium]|jgi:SAM-dependent methyltransferase|nr:class I SAM-dependent methyltransferase [Candidatus Limnocylindrales bacterium]